MARKLPYGQRARSVPHKRPFVWSVIWIGIFHLGIIACITALISFLIVNNTAEEVPKKNAYILIGCVALTAFSWLFGFFIRRTATCALCKGTPYSQSGAHIHLKATRIFPFNYSHSNFLKSIFALRFRCHYCGTPYDYCKPNHRK